jgi:6-phosphogluconolactonase
MNPGHPKRLLWSILPAIVLATLSTNAVAEPVTVFLGTYTRGWACPAPGDKKGRPCTSKGIYRARFDAATGTLSAPELAAESDNPSYLAVSPGGKYLYAVNEVDDYKGQGATTPTGAVSAFAIGADGSLRLINQLSSHGADPCHVSLDRTGKTVLVANYSGGSVASYRVGAGGELIDASHLQNPGAHGPHKSQDAAHGHFILEGPTAGRVYVADLGLDKVLVFDLDPATSRLTPHAAQPFVMVPPGSGPRHLAFHPGGRFLYTNNELATAASVLSHDPASGKLGPELLQTISTVPGSHKARHDNAEIQISRDGRFLYVSNRGHDSIAAFSVDPSTGKLKTLASVPSGGKEPRDFKIDPSGKYLLAAHQVSDDLVVFAIDPASGKLKPMTGGKPASATNATKVSKVVNVAFWTK